MAAVALLVVLLDTGQARDGLPVFVVHPRSAQIAAQLDRGVTADMIRVYRMMQVGEKKEIEPAYLLMSNRQGGFAKYGFWLDGRKRAGTPYIDVHQKWALTGSFGAIDQIFPHELAHAIIHQLGIEAPKGNGANQVHALTVRTDRFVAFDEGFAEHLQIMAVDHPGAAPETRALAKRQDLEAAAWRHLEQYRREMTARFAPASRMRMGYLLWYSNDERVLRYFAVKENRFIREARLPDDLLVRDHTAAYFLENTLPGDRDGALKPVPRLIESEGAVSALFHRWATDPELQRRRRDDAFYAQYGTSAAALSPLENVYLKLFAAMQARRTADVVSLVNSYRALFPDEAPLVDRVVSDTFGGQRMIAPREIWLANADFKTGTTMFDQFRGVPRVHTFDLNAASIVDLTSVPGVTPALARSIAAAGPYDSIEDLRRVPGAGANLTTRLKAMAAAMQKVTAQDEEDLSLRTILMPYAWRAGIMLLVAAIGGGAIYRVARIRAGAHPSWIRTLLAGLAVAFVGAIVHWAFGRPDLAIAAVMLLFGMPAALWQLRKSRRPAPALAALAIWVAMAIVPVVVTSAI